MWPIVAGALSGLFGGLGSYAAQKSANRTQEQINEENLEYQREFNQQVFEREDTAFRRAVTDAEQAGLSALAITGGAGAGGVASAPQVSGDNIRSAGLAGIASALDYAQAAANIQQTLSQTKKTEAETQDIGDNRQDMRQLISLRLQELTDLNRREAERLAFAYTELDVNAKLGMDNLTNQYNIAVAEIQSRERLAGQQIEADRLMQDKSLTAQAERQEAGFMHDSQERRLDRLHEQAIESMRKYARIQLAEVNARLEQNRMNQSLLLQKDFWQYMIDNPDPMKIWSNINQSVSVGFQGVGTLFGGGMFGSNFNVPQSNPIGFGAYQ